MNTTEPWNDARIVYSTQHEEQPVDVDAERDEALLRAIIRAVRRSPRLHAELVVALEHKV